MSDVTTSDSWDHRRSVLGRAVAVLDAFDEGETTVSVAELVRRVALPKTTVHRMVSELLNYGLLERAGRDVGLGVHLFELGCRVPAQRRLREVGLPYMQDVYSSTREAVLMGVLDGHDVVCTARVSGHDRGAVGMSEGERLPLHATAMGKAMLAFSPRTFVSQVIDAGLGCLTPHTIVVPEALLQDLARTCRMGVAYAREEAIMGSAAVAAPILGPGGEVLGALSVDGRALRFDATCFANAVRVGAAAIARRLLARPRAGRDVTVRERSRPGPATVA
ncbi:MAG: IclR family transcriptional regulator [Acidimicrobiia bacterium]